MANRYWTGAVNGGTGTWDASDTTNWSTASGGTGGASVPTTADAVIFDANSAAGVCTIGANVVGLSLTMTGYTGTLAFGANKVSLAGNNATIFTGAATYSVSGTPLIEAAYSGATGTRGINAGLPSAPNTISFAVTAGTDILRVVNDTIIRSLDLTGFAGTVENTRKILHGSLIISASCTLGAGANATTFLATGAQIITTAGKTIDFPLTFNSATGVWTFQEALTMGSSRAFTITRGTIELKSGVASTVGSLVVNAPNAKALRSSSAGSQATLSQASGTVNAVQLTVKDIAATGGATFNAPINLGNVDGGNNTGWNFAPAGEAGSRAAMSLGLSLAL